MKNKIHILFFTFMGMAFDIQHKPKHNNNLFIISNLSQYKSLILKQPGIKLIEIHKEIPNIVLDIRYATIHNFTKTKLYDRPRAFISRDALDSLKIIQKELNQIGLGIKIFDAYRPYAVTIKMFNIYPNPDFVAPPSKGSRHNRGCAIDLTLINLNTKEEIKMPTDYDAFTKQARPTAKLNNPQIEKNRNLLIHIMQKHGFKVTSSEWWHYDFKNFKQYPIINLDFATLEKL